ncbi:PP2C family protein-serine/threonine phosphatase [Mycoplasma miroungirhinis]|uniref:Serine/threonine-protein phosphatase n=1 Tax=Mycoplasma miroungirhinis TaxID=754516 RepID=A0A6M4JDS7_9MOLU|nr:protein phosphatase 2C domain-containing protein [Mycoplasma miroungirhinis]QJR44226.1 serine/threonine-protein phosphatase [Mycoplasma miroungirhinis]
MSIKWVIKSETGPIRKENQDFAGFVNKKNVVMGILCDGMGGHKNGSVASKVAVKEFIDFFNNSQIETIDAFDSKNIQKWFQEGLEQVTKKMKSLANMDSQYLDMGTTLVISLFFQKEQELYVFNLGDSHAYLYNGFLHQITKDQNIMNYLIDKENLSPEKAKNIHGWDRLVSALGPKKNAIAETYNIHKDSNPKYIILTSDGIHSFIPKILFETILNDNSPIEQKANKLVKNAIELKSNDNLTCLIMEVN